jgi:PhnB protein
MKPTLQPYLGFSGNTAEAMKFYQSVLGGELEIHKFDEYGMSTPETKDLIMHAVLKNDMLTFMASDGDMEHPVNMGNNIKMSITGSDEEKLTKYFNGLAEGGTIDLPLEKQVWGDTFGMLTDKFGVHWMVNISSQPPTQK